MAGLASGKRSHQPERLGHHEGVIADREPGVPVRNAAVISSDALFIEMSP
jgi:hypothetical protein